MEYITAAEAAEKWGVSLRQVQRLMSGDRIPGTKKYGKSWMIPANAKKPGDLRNWQNRRQQKNSLSSDLDYVCAATIVPYPQPDPDAILDTVSEARLRLQFVGELAYLRGDFERVKRCFCEIGDDAAKLRACPLTIAAAICTGDYSLYREIETYCKGIISANPGTNAAIIADLALDTAHVSALAPGMVSNWLKDGDFCSLPPWGRPDATYKRAKYFQSIRNYEAMLALSQTALSFCDFGQGISYCCLYLRIACAIACSELGKINEAKRYLSDAMDIALPHGFITPFAESVSGLGGLLEQLLDQKFPEYYRAITEQWKATVVNWLSFHNRFTKENITLILSLQECQIARLYVQNATYRQIADQFHISVKTVDNKMRIIYEKLFIKSKKELTKFIL